MSGQSLSKNFRVGEFPIISQRRVRKLGFEHGVLVLHGFELALENLKIKDMINFTVFFITSPPMYFESLQTTKQN